MIGCRPVEMWWWQPLAEVVCAGKRRKTWYDCVKDDI